MMFVVIIPGHCDIVRSHGGCDSRHGHLMSVVVIPARCDIVR